MRRAEDNFRWRTLRRNVQFWAWSVLAVSATATVVLPWWRPTSATLVLTSLRTPVTSVRGTWSGVDLLGPGPVVVLVVAVIALVSEAASAAWSTADAVAPGERPTRQLRRRTHVVGGVVGGGLLLATAQVALGRDDHLLGGLVASAAIAALMVAFALRCLWRGRSDRRNASVATTSSSQRGRVVLAGVLTLALAVHVLFGEVLTVTAQRIVAEPSSLFDLTRLADDASSVAGELTGSRAEGPSDVYRLVATTSGDATLRTGSDGPLPPGRLITIDGRWALAGLGSVVTIDDRGRAVVVIGSDGPPLRWLHEPIHWTDGERFLASDFRHVYLGAAGSEPAATDASFHEIRVGHVGPDGTALVDISYDDEGAARVIGIDDLADGGPVAFEDLPEVVVDLGPGDRFVEDTRPTDDGGWVYVRETEIDEAELVRADVGGSVHSLAGGAPRSCGLTSVATASSFDYSYNLPLADDGNGGWWLAVSTYGDEPTDIVHVDATGTMSRLSERAPATVRSMVVESDGDLVLEVPGHVLEIADPTTHLQPLPRPTEDCLR
ncbi:MAG: hypothetical protein S0880_27710 [Actinomycetota bacterium]|nr:hypothetical protein [Actinomycetota bacterium]